MTLTEYRDTDTDGKEPLFNKVLWIHNAIINYVYYTSNKEAMVPEFLE
jgi:hypothetical protein